MKLLASDYDGTLNRNGSVSKEDIKAIEKWRSSGNLFVLVTGRGFPSALREMKYYGVACDFYICNNGSVIYDSDLKCVDSITGDSSVIRPIVDLIIKYKGGRAAVSGGIRRCCVILDRARDISPEENWIEYSQIENIDFKFTQIDTNTKSDAEAKKLTEEINKTFGKYVLAHQNGTNVDITPPEASKPYGINRLSKMLDIPKENILAIGDNTNDLEMILEFNGFAVASGNPFIISKASKIYPSIEALIEENI